MQLTDFQHRILNALAEHDEGLTSAELLTALDASQDALRRETRELTEKRLVQVAVASLSSGWWTLTPLGRGYASTTIE